MRKPLKAERGTAELQPEFQEGHGYSREDWDEVSDNPEWIEEDFARARPFAEVFPEMAAAIERSRAELPEGTGRIGMTISVDREVFARLVASGPDWPDRIDAALRRVVGL